MNAWLHIAHTCTHPLGEIFTQQQRRDLNKRDEFKSEKSNNVNETNIHLLHRALIVLRPQEYVAFIKCFHNKIYEYSQINEHFEHINTWMERSTHQMHHSPSTWNTISANAEELFFTNSLRLQWNWKFKTKILNTKNTARAYRCMHFSKSLICAERMHWISRWINQVDFGIFDIVNVRDRNAHCTMQMDRLCGIKFLMESMAHCIQCAYQFGEHQWAFAFVCRSV